MVSRLTNGKVKAIILTLLITNPQHKFTAKELAEFINSHEFGIWEKITPNRIGSMLRSANPHCKDILNVVQHKRGPGNKTVYWIDG